MEIRIREAKDDDLKIGGDLFAAHLQEQFSIDPHPAPNRVFDPHWFIKAMMNPPVNHMLLADVEGQVVGLARLGILYGEGLIPLGGGPKRSESSYMKRLPVILLGKCRNILDGWISRIEAKRTVAQMCLPIRRGYIADFYVIPQMRRKGVGSVLLQASMDWFGTKTVLIVDLNYLEANEVGKAFWKAMGFDGYRVLARKDVSRTKKE